MMIFVMYYENIMKKLEGEGEYQHFLWKKKFFILTFFYPQKWILPPPDFS